MEQISSTIQPRPQPLGVYPPPAGYLILRPSPDAYPLLARLRNGCVDIDWPDEWRFHKSALEGDLETAWSLLKDDWTPHATYNRFVLRPDPARLEPIRETLGGEWSILAGLVAYAVGLADDLPEASTLTGELAALAGAVLASQALERGDPSAAISALDLAVEAAAGPSPVFASQLLAQRAELRMHLGAERLPEAVKDLRRAIELAGETPLERLRAELWLNLGIAYQNLAEGRREPLLEAVKAYQGCLRSGVSAAIHGDLYARAHHNLALAYLALPRTDAGDHLRLGIAVQSLRAALEVYDRETNPQLWASTQLNLANALQYLPSSHPEENLIQAVELYERIFAVRDRAMEPVGYARLLADQANALAHLGMFNPALEKLDEAHKLFHWHGEPESAQAVLDLVDRIHRRREGALSADGALNRT